jgi:hypothetical protein
MPSALVRAVASGGSQLGLRLVQTCTSSPSMGPFETYSAAWNVSDTSADFGYGQLTLPMHVQSPTLQLVPQTPLIESTNGVQALPSTKNPVCVVAPCARRQSNTQSCAGQAEAHCCQAMLQSADVAHARSAGQALVVRQSWHPAAASGGMSNAPSPPHRRPHSVSQWVARHAATGPSAGVATPAGWSSAHCDRHGVSPLQPPRHDSYGSHVVSEPHAVDSVQQLVAAQEAQVGVP